MLKDQHVGENEIAEPRSVIAVYRDQRILLGDHVVRLRVGYRPVQRGPEVGPPQEGVPQKSVRIALDDLLEVSKRTVHGLRRSE